METHRKASHKTLILDSAYQPVTIVSWEKAMTLMFSGKGEPVEMYPDVSISSVNQSYPLPAILKINYVAKSRPRVNFSRWTVFSRDNFKCCYCGEKHPSKGLSLDHVVPLSKGGLKNWTNIVTACFECNQKKANRTPQQAGLKMHHTPHEPKWNPLLFLKMCRTEMHKLWEPWLNP